MAKLIFHLPNGEQMAFRLFTDRRLRIGRERGNDIVLRDARVSRTHAEISFERGFFIVRDLGSSNGTFVNGREVKVAPLTEGSEVRIGSSVGRFSEELTGSPPTGPGSGRDFEKGQYVAGSASEEPGVFEPESFDDEPGHTKKHPKMQDSEWDYHREGEWLSERSTDELPDSDESRTSEVAAARPEEVADLLQTPEAVPPIPKREAIEHHPLRWTLERSDTGRSVLSGENDRKVYFDAPLNAVGLFASFTAIAMLVAGFGASLAFLGRGEYGAATLTFVLTMAFVFAVMQLVPRQDIDLYEDEGMSRLWVALRQETRATFPSLVYSAREADGNPFAYFRKSFSSNLGRRRWEIRDRNDLDLIAEAQEEASFRTWARKFVGAITAGLVTDFIIRSNEKVIGRITRYAGAFYRSIIEIDVPVIDARSAAGLAVLLEVVERK